jgi:Cu-Zn family superoxide dismutase
MSLRWVVMVGVVTGVMSGSPVCAETGQAVIQGTSEGSTVSGTATLSELPGALKVSVQVSGVAPGTHGLHIHQFGDCGNQGNAAGGHYNPEGAPHGFLPTDGFAKAHAGDFGNLEAAADGTGSIELVLTGLSLSGGPHSVGGRAIILHEKADDFGQPTGNAGGRIGCGAIVITGDGALESSAKPVPTAAPAPATVEAPPPAPAKPSEGVRPKDR